LEKMAVKTERERERQTDRERETERETETESERERERQTERETETDRQRQRQTDRDRDRQTETETQTETDRDRDRQTDRASARSSTPNQTDVLLIVACIAISEFSSVRHTHGRWQLVPDPPRKYHPGYHRCNYHERRNDYKRLLVADPVVSE